MYQRGRLRHCSPSHSRWQTGLFWSIARESRPAHALVQFPDRIVGLPPSILPRPRVVRDVRFAVGQSARTADSGLARSAVRGITPVSLKTSVLATFPKFLTAGP